ncbi:MAG TPA: toxin-antitoxin system YwqK family antitoxin [Bacteroidia bacterium]|jgi:antitoxin component YwqK of YwqJK toxin-antitoxin module|nr:toxin-antitoxin system YwqK family antitoxin [Bacteroidia bacterium]
MTRKFTFLVVLALLCGLGLKAGDSLDFVDGAGKRQGPWKITGKMQPTAGYSETAIVAEGRYKDNLKVGVWITYFATGIKSSEMTYVNGRPNGPATTYFENGKIEETGTWVGSRWTGDYHRYYDTGVERQHFTYNTTGVRNGMATYTNPNGTKEAEVNIVNGKEDGWKKEYDANGNLVRETFYNGGVIDNTKTIEHATTATVSVAPEDPSKDKTPPPPPAKVVATDNWNGEGQYTLMKGGQVSQKGTFHAYRLVTGEQRIYDNNGFCIQVKLYENSKYVGDGVVPEDARK